MCSEKSKATVAAKTLMDAVSFDQMISQSV